MSQVSSEENEVRLDEVLAEYLKSCDSGNPLDRESFLAQYPELADQLRELLGAADAIESMAGPTLAESLQQAAKSTRPFANHPNRDNRGGLAVSDGDSSVNGTTANFVMPDAVGLSATLPVSPVRFSSDQSSLEGTLPLNSPLVSPNHADHEFSHADLAPAKIETSQPVLPCRFGDYILEKLLGRGGMGVVYRGHQLNLDRRVAVKMIRSGALASEDEVQRFYAEARSAAKLDHPNIVTVYQCGECDGHHFFSMDFVEGTDLSRRVASGPLDGQVAARYVRDVALAIQYAHERGVLHRDLKPANVLIDSEDNVHVTDFGLAKVMGRDSGLTRSGAAMGTPSYMSPEQASGRNDEHAPTTDVYSLGAILFTLLTGKPPFQGKSVVQTMMQVIHRPAPNAKQVLPSVDEDLATIVAKCLQKQPNRRYHSAQELADELDHYLEGRPISARPLGPLERAWHWSIGIPLIGALVGLKVLDPTPSHRWAQRMIITVLMAIPLALMTWSLASQWLSSRLPSTFRIAAGDPAGTYYSVSQQLATQVQDQVSRPSNILTTAGSLENSRLLLTRQADLGLLQSTSVRSADLAVIAPLYHEAVHILIQNDFQAKQIEDFRNARIWFGAPESGSHEAAELILEASGLKPNDYAVVRGDWATLQKGDVAQVAFIVIKPGSPRVRELLDNGKYHLLHVDRASEIALDEPAFRAFKLTQDMYPNLPSDGIETLAITAYLACRRDASEKLVRSALDSIYADGPLRGQLIPRERARHWRGVAWHPAAEAYFASH